MPSDEALLGRDLLFLGGRLFFAGVPGGSGGVGVTSSSRLGLVGLPVNLVFMLVINLRSKLFPVRLFLSISNAYSILPYKPHPCSARLFSILLVGTWRD